MEQQDKLGLLAGIFDCAPAALAPETTLDTLHWDSMAMLSVIAIVRARFGKRLTGGELRSFKTVGDLLGAME